MMTFGAVSTWIGMLTYRSELFEQVADQAVRRGRREAADELARISRRECEVGGLIAEGLSNAEIARRPVLVEGTVANYVEHGLYRLGDDGDEPDQPAPQPLRPVR
jgi:DNA-binding NarL/FixJ family response regulator